ncbi:MAG TPA: GNAT family N-acetyltransferase [Candidatus Mcinerneyibacteriales bacterium]|nr:GNAT family N-acetyltransferase [Candidatus Mcinerneyibacteriales bacterium]
MIRKIGEPGREEMTEFLKKGGALNLFFKADLENFGMESPRHSFWGQYAGGCLSSVVLRFYDSQTLSLSGSSDIEELTPFLQKGRSLAGEKSAVDGFRGILDPRSYREQIFSHLKVLKEVQGLPEEEVSLASCEDCDELFELQLEIEEFELDESGKESYCDALLSGTGRIAYLRKEGGIVSSASSVAEYSGGAMIVAVATRPGHRKKGYAAACLQALCRSLLAEGKEPSLFYDNPQAGRIYRRLGFETAGSWAMGTILKEEK